jgi:hypothetical protein
LGNAKETLTENEEWKMENGKWTKLRLDWRL